MDLKDLTPTSDDIVVELTHPATGDKLFNEDKTQMTIILYAPHSKEYKKVLHTQTNYRLKTATKTGSINITSEELEENTLSLMASVTKSWDITFDKEKPECTYEKAMALYDEVFWIKTQLDQAVESYLGFMQG